MGRTKDKIRKETVTFRIAEDTDRRIETLRKSLIQANAKRSLFGGAPIKATRSDMVEQGIADLYRRKAYEYEHGRDMCGYCEQPRNIHKQYRELDELYIELKDLYNSMKNNKNGIPSKEKEKHDKKDV